MTTVMVSSWVIRNIVPCARTDPPAVAEYSPGGYNEQYSPTPTGASAEYYPHGNPHGNIYPPPPAPAGGYGVPPYNPQDYAGPGQAPPTQPAGPAGDPYGYNPAAPHNNPYAPPEAGQRGEERTADNVSPLTTDGEGACHLARQPF